MVMLLEPVSASRALFSQTPEDASPFRAQSSFFDSGSSLHLQRTTVTPIIGMGIGSSLPN